MEDAKRDAIASLGRSGRPGVSIILVSWNSHELMRVALSSFLPLDGEHEVIVVDNASTDGSADVIEREFPNVRMIRSETNRGFAGGVNIGLRAARFPYSLLLNPDTLVIGSAIERLLDYATAHPRAGIIGPRVLNEDGSLQSSRFRFPSLFSLALQASYLYQVFRGSRLLNRERYAGSDETTPHVVDAVSGCCFLMRQDFLDEVGLLDESYFMYAEETDLCYRAQRSGWEVHYAPVGEIVHTGGGSSRLAKEKNFLEFRRSIIRFFSKHRGRLAAEGARALLMLFLLVRIPYWWIRSHWGADREVGREQLSNYQAGLQYLSRPLSTILIAGLQP